MRYFRSIFLALPLLLFNCEGFARSIFCTEKSERQKNIVSSTPDFLHFCKEASKNPELFIEFRSHPLLSLFIDFTSFEEGKIYAELILKKYPFLLEKIDQIRNEDLVGSPKMYEFDGIGKISPSTLRNLYFCGILQSTFGDLHKASIVEIGSGYGGWCKLLCNYISPESYTLIDHPEKLELARAFLKAHGIEGVRLVDFEQLEDLSLDPFDLVISHYGFSEMGKKLQDRLIDVVLQKAKNGYLLCNQPPKSYRVLSKNKNDLLKALRFKRIPIQEELEEPKIGKENYIITWKNQ